MPTTQLALHPFRGSTAVRDGQLTRGALRSRRFVRLCPDVHVAATFGG